MVLIRVFEEETDRQYKRDRIGGYCHLCIGQEGATVGACAALEPDDLLLDLATALTASRWRAASRPRR